MQRPTKENKVTAVIVTSNISWKFGALSPDRSAQISALPIDRLEELGEALLDFTTIDD